MTTSAPRARVAATFTCGAPSGITTVAFTSASRAAHARARAWLPEGWVTTPRARPAASSVATALQAPRSLKTPTGCNDSGLTHSGRSCSPQAQGSSGVLTTDPRMRSAAYSTCVMVTDVISEKVAASCGIALRHTLEPRRS
jgi:hypothetical protein